ncbi:hypothetical protein PMAYCL1PPCAC_02792 [Pristionchus mayeri]|uniref:RING-type domain-containing protein n=1 Tax=Pristionchus mayeri TaxID=1317129 RepID=A0AAN5C798_9BILA|nr:hypothetical protein PMAYCL1PPCAC_02792 [Pristionchus mayeri]
MGEFKVPGLPRGQNNQIGMISKEIGERINLRDEIKSIVEDGEQPSSSSSSSIDVFTDDSILLHGYTAAQYAGLAPVNGLDLLCKVCHRVMVDPLTTICKHTMCTRCFTMNTLNHQPEPCPVCGHIFGPVSIWYFVQSGYDEAAKYIHISRNNLLEEYFTSPIVRSRFNCINQIHEMTNPNEVYELFRDIFWFYKNPENEHLIQRAFAHTFLRIMSTRLKKRVNEEIKRIFQMEVELGYLNRYNNDSDARLIESFMAAFPDRAEKSKRIFITTDPRGNQSTRSTIFPEYYPEKMVLTHLPCNYEPSAIVCTVSDSLPSFHRGVQVTTSHFVSSLAKEEGEEDNLSARTPSSHQNPADEPFVHFVRVPSGKHHNVPSGSNSRTGMNEAGVDEPMDTGFPSSSSAVRHHPSCEPSSSGNSYLCGGTIHNHSKPMNCPRVMAKHPCMHSECCNCGLGVGIQQYYSALGTKKETDSPGTPPVSLPKGIKEKEESLWDPNWNGRVALSNSSYPMLSSEYLNDRMNGLIEKQEVEALALYEKLRENHLRGQLEVEGEKAYCGVGYDMFTQVGNYLENASKYLRMDKISEFPYKNGQCVSCLDFDSTGGLLAIGGTAKCVRIFDFEEQLRDYSNYETSNALMEIPTLSKLSGVAWCKSEPQNVLMSEYDGVATLYDVNAGQEIRRYKDHNRRIWDASFAHDTVNAKFATCGDDGKVFLYKAAQPSPVHAIDVGFSVTSVEFCPWAEYQLAVGVSDATVNIYDIRFTKPQFLQLRGHKKAVSYVRYMDGGPDKHNLISAAIDSSIQLWNLDKETWKCERTFKGHLNEKNFVGLATNGEHFVTGSEGNDIVLYHQFFSNPMATTNFLKTIEFSDFDEQHDRNDFVSCLKWKKGTNIFVAGNNQGQIQAYKAH